MADQDGRGCLVVTPQAAFTFAWVRAHHRNLKLKNRHLCFFPRDGSFATETTNAILPACPHAFQPACSGPREPSSTGEPSSKGKKIDIGQGVTCDTLQQVERYVALRGNGTETNIALQTVKEEAHLAACGVALVMFSADARVAGLTAQGKLLSMIRIDVRAVSDGPVWLQIPPIARYTVTAETGQVI